jgi:hypothetical protein
MALKDLDLELQRKLIERIQALFALGDESRNNSTEEAQTAVKKAQELLQKYNLSMSEVMTVNDSATIIDGITDQVSKEWKKSTISTWEKNLTAIVGECCETTGYIEQTYCRGSKSRTWAIRYIGTPWDVAIACELFKYIHGTLKKLSVQNYPESTPHQRSYLEGACHCLAQRVREQNRKFKAEQAANNQFALMVVSKEDAIRKYIEDNLEMKQTKQLREKKPDWFAYQHGVEDAKKFDLGTDKRLKEQPQ